MLYGIVRLDFGVTDANQDFGVWPCSRVHSKPSYVSEPFWPWAQAVVESHQVLDLDRAYQEVRRGHGIKPAGTARPSWLFLRNTSETLATAASLTLGLKWQPPARPQQRIFYIDINYFL